MDPAFVQRLEQGGAQRNVCVMFNERRGMQRHIVAATADAAAMSNRDNKGYGLATEWSEGSLFACGQRLRPRAGVRVDVGFDAWSRYERAGIAIPWVVFETSLGMARSGWHCSLR